MAKPGPIDGLRPDGGVGPNARRIVRARLDEAVGFAPWIRDPLRVRELHDMRIAWKRVRYLMETFAVAFPDGEWLARTAKELQDVLGEIHDCDVQVPMLERERDRLAASPASDRGEHPEMHGLDRLIARRHADRADRYARFVAMWDRLEAEDFARRARRALRQ